MGVSGLKNTGCAGGGNASIRAGLSAASVNGGQMVMEKVDEGGVGNTKGLGEGVVLMEQK